MGQSKIKLTGSKNITKVIFKCKKRERTVIPSLLRHHQKPKKFSFVTLPDKKEKVISVSQGSYKFVCSDYHFPLQFRQKTNRRALRAPIYRRVEKKN